MPRFRRFRSAETETNLRKADWQAGEHGVAELGWETALFYQLAFGAMGQARRRQRAIPPRLRLGRQRTEAGVRSRFHRAKAGAPASHALRFNKNRREPHDYCEQLVSQKIKSQPRIARITLIVQQDVTWNWSDGGPVFPRLSSEGED